MAFSRQSNQGQGPAHNRPARTALRRRIRLLMVAGLACANVAVIAVSANALHATRQHVERGAEVTTQNVAGALDQNISRSAEKIDFALRIVADELERQLAGAGIDEAAMNAFLTRQEQRLPEVEAIRVARQDGLVILGKGLNKDEKASWADRDYFHALRNHAGGGLQISRPALGRVAKKYIVGFSRRYNYPDGRFAGVVSAPIAVDYFSDMLAKFDLGPSGSLILRDAAMGLITRVPAISGKAAGIVGDRSTSNEFRALAARVNAATYFTPAGADGFARIATFRRLDTVPMTIVASVAKETYLAQWRAGAVRTMAMACGFTFLSLVLGGFLYRLSRRVEKDAQRLEWQLTEISSLQGLLQEQAVRDPLTGLYNRRYLDETFPRELSQAKRGGYPLAVVMLDLDHFKRVNDTHGHAAGDEVLKILSSIIARDSRDADLACRYGGEEFLVVLPQMSIRDAMRRVEGWRRTLAEDGARIGHAAVNATFSAGVCGYPEHGHDTETLIACADKALYRSKHEGRNRVTVFEHN